MVQNAQIIKDTKTPLPQVIAISSGKGGVGKSSITVNLAISLARRGASVCILDADTGLANANILLGLTPQYSLEHVLFGAKSIEEVMLDGPHGMKIVPGANGISECVSLHPRQQLRLTRELTRIENNFDYLLVDTAAGIATTTLDFVAASHHALIVITPEPTSLTDAFSLIKLLKRRPGNIFYHVVVNMCTGSRQAKGVFHRFCSAVNKYIGVQIHYLGFIQLDESMRTAVVLQNPVATFNEDDPSCQNFTRLAQNLEESAKDIPLSPSFSSFWFRQFRKQQSENAKSQKTISTPNTVASLVPKASPEPLSNKDELLELRARLLQLIEQGQETSELKQFFKDTMEAFRERFEELPLDLPRIIENHIASSTDDNSLLETIAKQLEPWLEHNNTAANELAAIATLPENSSMDVESSVETLAPVGAGSDNVEYDEIGKLESDDLVQNVATVSNKKSLTASVTGVSQLSSEFNHSVESYYRAHQFDVERFGSQEKLVQLLQCNEPLDKTLEDLLNTLR